MKYLNILLSSMAFPLLVGFAFQPAAEAYSASDVAAVTGGQNCPNADLRGADLSGADLTGLDLTAANLQNANLTGARLERAILNQASLQGCNLKRAVFSAPTSAAPR